ncbi:hypothetical protein AN0459.2 [Aspergillus nidulans FGSC A4]|nr:hypothetical protein AN0459.2 [Aspergillus nidulans FGSC A4]|eukprot:XP_658063.1 hypothetical protein AN0459.2 [Aspergillus nidulans FGSC A4]
MTGSKAHSTRKRMLSNIYSKSYLQSSRHLQLISKTIIFDRLLPILQAAASSKTDTDVHDLNQGLTMDFVSAYLFGLANGTNFLQNAEYRREMLRLYQCRKPYEFYHQEVPNILALLKKIGIRLIPKWCDDANRILDSWGLELCDKAEASVASSDLSVEPVVYKHLKQAISKQAPLKIDDQKLYADYLEQQRLDIACEMYDHLTAGHETSAVVLTYLMWELSQHIEVQKDLHKELLTLQPRIAPRCLSGHAELPSPKSIDSLPFLEAILTETLRLHASIPGIQPRVTPTPTCTLVGPILFIEIRRYFQTLRHGSRSDGSKTAINLPNWRKESDGFGRSGAVDGCVWEVIWLYKMKLVIAAIYTNFRTTIVNDDGIEAIDAYTVKPKGEKLILRFEYI